MKLRIASWPAVAIAITVSAGVAYAVAQPGAATPAKAVTCVASQPVYTSNDIALVGTWQVTLHAGEEVDLPDYDVATCRADGTLDVEQP